MVGLPEGANFQDFVGSDGPIFKGFQASSKRPVNNYGILNGKNI